MSEQPKIWQAKFLKKILDDDKRTAQDLADEIFEKNFG